MKKTQAPLKSALRAAFMLALAMPGCGQAKGGVTPVHGSASLSLAGHGSFYVGGETVSLGATNVRAHAMYVEYFVPSRRTHKTPVVLVHGNYQSGATFLSTPDGRAGWADELLRQGYAVYVVDQPMRGRSPYFPEIDGPANVITAAQAERQFTAPERGSPVPQAAKHTQWPGSGGPGDPAFEQFVASLQPSVAGPNERIDAVVRDALGALLRKIGPAVVLTHSRAGTFGWEAADDSPNLVKAVIAVEPNGPAFYDAPAAGPSGKEPSTMARPWGVTYGAMHYAPAVTSPAELVVERQAKADGPDLVACWTQKGEPRKLVNLAHIPALVVVGEASYHAPYDHCTAAFLKQAGVPVTFTRLETVGIKGNGHLMMAEKNSLQIIQMIARWLSSRVN